MKSFILASTILALVIASIIGYSIAALDKAEKLILICERAESSPDALDELASEWQDCQDFFALSVNREELDQIQSSLNSALAFRGRDAVACNAALIELLYELSQLADSNRLLISNIV